jgi:probable HAF family extracellular repeat protein
LVGAGILASSASAATGDIFNLGTLDGASSAGYGINDAGQVAGTAGTSFGGAFRYSGTPGAGGTMTNLGALPGGTGSFAWDINNAGQVTGGSYTIGGTPPFHAFLYTGTPGAGGTMADLGTLGGLYSEGRSVNDAGQVAGEAATLGAEHAFRYSGTPGAGGAMADLGTLGGTNSLAFGINNAGQVAGYSQTTGDAAVRDFRYTGTPGAGGAMTDLGTLGGTSSAGYAINNAGQVAGYAQTPADAASHAFRYTGTPGAGGAMADLGTLGGSDSTGWAMNDAGFVVGWADRSAAAGGGSWATLWRTDAANTAVDLDAWLDAVNPSQGAFWTLTEARAINNNGLITGRGEYNDGPGGLTDGTRAFVLDASGLVPEPDALALLCLAGVSILRRRRQVQSRNV